MHADLPFSSLWVCVKQCNSRLPLDGQALQGHTYSCWLTHGWPDSPCHHASQRNHFSYKCIDIVLRPSSPILLSYFLCHFLLHLFHLPFPILPAKSFSWHDYAERVPNETLHRFPFLNEGQEIILYPVSLSSFIFRYVDLPIPLLDGFHVFTSPFLLLLKWFSYQTHQKRDEYPPPFQGNHSVARRPCP